MAPDPTRTLRAAAAGAVAAGVWAAQQPLDMRVFGVAYDDAELLGSALTRKRGTPRTTTVGAAIHLANGAAFGAVYGLLPGRGPLKGLAAGLAEHLATWPATRFVGRLHPVGGSFPTLWGDHRAFGQAVWRHALFGLVLGTLEARLNPPRAKPDPPAPAAGPSELNGHKPVDSVIVQPAP